MLSSSSLLLLLLLLLFLLLLWLLLYWSGLPGLFLSYGETRGRIIVKSGGSVGGCDCCEGLTSARVCVQLDRGGGGGG